MAGARKVVARQDENLRYIHAQCPLWVINGLFVTTLKMSAFGVRTDMNHPSAKSPLIAKCGHPGAGKRDPKQAILLVKWT